MYKFLFLEFVNKDVLKGLHSGAVDDGAIAFFQFLTGRDP